MAQKRSNRTCRAVCLAAVILAVLVMCVPALAETTKKPIPKSVRIWPGIISENGLDFTLPKKGDRIKNLKGSGSLKVKTVLMDVAPDQLTEVSLACYCKKTGTYTLSFDIYGKNGKKRSSRQITVYVKKDEPFKKILLNGEQIYGNEYVTGKKGKLQVVMNSGYKLVKIRIGKHRSKEEDYGKNTQVVYHWIRNGSTFTYSTVREFYSYQNGAPGEGSYYTNWRRAVFPETIIEITYKDKYSKRWVKEVISLEKVG